jgi:hypothetical protein
MVDESPVEKKPDKLVWLSSNCCDLTPVEPSRPVQPAAPKTADQPLPRLRRLLQRLRRPNRFAFRPR